jgi:DnaK suppressor protein
MAKEKKKPTRKHPEEQPKAAKKTVRKHVVEEPPAARPKPKTVLSEEELAHFRRLLLEKRAEIIGDVSSMETDTLKKSRDAGGELSNMPIHMADLGTDNYEQEFALGLLDSERKILHEINDALIRIDEGTYGICEGTGEPIPKARLEASPWARYSVKYASLLEKGLVQEPEHPSYEERRKKIKKRKTKGEEAEAEETETEAKSEEEPEEEELEEQEEVEEEEQEEEEEEEEPEEGPPFRAGREEESEEEEEEEEEEEGRYF